MKQLFIALLVATSFLTQAQTLTGTLTKQAGQQITLTGFNYYKTQEMGKTVIDSLGNFSFSYPTTYKGMAILKTQDHSSLILVLSEKKITLKGNHLKEIHSLDFTNSTENKNFINYAKMQGLHTNALSAWQYLENIYQKKALFKNQNQLKEIIKKEQKRIHTQDALFITNLDNNSYVRWFIPYRKLVQEMANIVNNTKHLPKALAEFRKSNFAHKNFKNSGLFKELIEGHYRLLENMGQSKDSIYTQMNISTKHIIENLQSNDSLLNKVSNKLFNYFEKNSLFKASEYLSVSLLNNSQCSLDTNLKAKLESYRKLKIGNIAPEILLKNNTKLSTIKTNKLLVFGASWCPTCKKEALALLNLYDAWKLKNVEIIYISIDTSKTDFETAYKNAPWQTFCDYKGWETQAAKDYSIFGTPTYFLLDDNNKILARPNSVEDANTWITKF